MTVFEGNNVPQILYYVYIYACERKKNLLYSCLHSQQGAFDGRNFATDISHPTTQDQNFKMQ